MDGLDRRVVVESVALRGKNRVSLNDVVGARRHRGRRCRPGRGQGERSQARSEVTATQRRCRGDEEEPSTRSATGSAATRARRLAARLDEVTGGPARRFVVIVLASVLALDSADKASVGASSEQLQHRVGTGTTGVGVLLAVTSPIAGLATLPAGILVDRTSCTRLLQTAVVLWAVAMLASAAATSYLFLLLARVGLGVVTAVAATAVASLIGDYAPQRHRGCIYGLVLSGELIGTASGSSPPGCW